MRIGMVELQAALTGLLTKLHLENDPELLDCLEVAGVAADLTMQIHRHLNTELEYALHKGKNSSRPKVRKPRKVKRG